MGKIVRLALVVEAAKTSGYQVTASLYQEHDRSPSQLEEYGPLVHRELLDVCCALLDAYRPGWERHNSHSQPSLLSWRSDGDLLEGQDGS